MPIVQTKCLTKSFKGLEVLKGVSFEVRSGSIFGIIGSSGAGKSTLIRCLVGLEKPTSGTVRIEGTLGMIFQQFNLFSHLTALENVCFAMGDRDEAKRLLKLVGLEGKEQLYPAQMSGGQKQRVGIARALACKPKVLFCDEATSALDPETTQNILDLLNRLNEELGLTIILITHEMEVIRAICHEVAVLDHGEIVEVAPVADLFASPRHATTRRFVETIRHETHFKPKGEMLRLLFRGESVKQAVISRIVRESGVDVNILLGGIDVFKKEKIGTLLVDITGSDEERKKARSILKEMQIECEVVSC